MDSNRRLVVIGAGFSGLTAAALLAKDGWNVTIMEKNADIGGSARVWKSKGFTFDMGPTWYLMPEVFERYFSLMGHRCEDYYETILLNPSYRVFFEDAEQIDITPDIEETKATFERFEPGGAKKLNRFLENAAYRYDIAMREFLYREYHSIFDFFNIRMIVQGSRLKLFRSLDKEVSSYFTDHRAKKILEYAMVFLGSSPYNARAIYSIMAHIDLTLGVWAPLGGMGSVIEAVRKLGEYNGVVIHTEEPVKKIEQRDDGTTHVITNTAKYPADVVLSGADYVHVETDLLDGPCKSYPSRYWQKKVIAPSMFLIYLGINKRIGALTHHNFYFATKWDEHFTSIFDSPCWPVNPSYYVHCPSKTEDTLAPTGCETVLILVPVAPGLDDNDERRQLFTEQIIGHFEKLIGTGIRDSITVQRVFSHRDFISDYNSYQGTALGLSHTLLQTAVFRPSHRSNKMKNLFYTGQYTHPGIGVPMAFIASEIVAGEIKESINGYR